MSIVRQALRSLLGRPLFALVAVLTLALGVATCLSVFSVVSAVLLKPLPYSQPDRQVMLWESNPSKGEEAVHVSPANFVDWRHQNQAFRTLAAFVTGTASLSGNGEPQRAQVAYVSGDFFPGLGVGPRLGRALTLQDDLPGAKQVTVLSARLWKSAYGGDPGILGRVLDIDGQPYEVVGVMPASFRFPDTTDLWLTMNLGPEAAGLRDSHYLQVVGVLRPGVPLARAQSEMSLIGRRLGEQYPATNAGRSVRVVSLHDQLVGDVRPALIALFGAVGLVLLLACLNISTLILARALGRRKECAVRIALGASRWSLARQFLAEGLIVSTLGGTLGLVLANWGIELLTALGPADVPRLSEATIDGSVAVLAIGLSLLTGLFLGGVPLFLLTEKDLYSGLHDRSGTSTVSSLGHRGREWLVVAEIVLTLILVIGSGLLIRSFQHLRGTDMGFRPAGLSTLQLALQPVKYQTPQQQRTMYQELLGAISAIPGVRSAAVSTSFPLVGEDPSLHFTIVGRPLPGPGSRFGAKFEGVSPGYFRTLGVSLRQGRDFEERDGAGNPGVAVIDEAMARQFWPGESPLGQRLLVGRETLPREIVGVVGDVKHGSLDAPAEPRMYLPLAQYPWPELSLIVRTAPGAAGVADGLRKAVRSVDRNQAVSDLATFDQILARELARPLFDMLILVVFAVLALVLAVLGVYGLCAYLIEQKTAEIGVRMALGAQAADILGYVMRQGLRPVVVGGFLGLAAALAATRLLSSLLYGIRAFDLATYVVSALLLTVIALLACLLPARRASRVDPMIALKRAEV
ncbi:MAG TPA: ABC transporter permease [Thermoanaerobaculia bacterium]|jgi:putative ABC transport system permease protein|nr:ABC transporter permease [Thermoanaerobaculia bacterium]